MSALFPNQVIVSAHLTEKASLVGQFANTYVFKVENDNLLQHNCSKKFHVSPFIEMNCDYF